MIYREQAIEILQRYVTENKTILIKHKFPHEIFKTDFNEDEWEIQYNKRIWEKSFMESMKHVLEKSFEKVFVLKQTLDFTILITDSIDYLKLINDLDIAQKEFDLIKDNDLELSTFIKHTSFIQETENKLIDKAEILIKVMQKVEKELEEYKREAEENYLLL